MRPFLICRILLIALLAGAGAQEPPAKVQEQGYPALKDAVVLIIRHAEKSAEGPELSPEGEKRAQEYVKYFQEFKVDGSVLKLSHLFAAADSKSSHRPRLTLEPLGKALGLEIDQRFSNKKPQMLAEELRSRDHGKGILICWHHGEIPELLRALGADPESLLPNGKWTDDVFGWVLELRFDHEGRLDLKISKRVNEHLGSADRD